MNPRTLLAVTLGCALARPALAAPRDPIPRRATPLARERSEPALSGGGGSGRASEPRGARPPQDPAPPAEPPPSRVTGEAPGWDPGRSTTSRLRDEHSGRPAGGRDGVYGRFDGLFDLGLALGTEVGTGGASGAARVSLRYFSTAGVYVQYADAFGAESPFSERLVSFGVDLTPAFIPRWSSGLEGTTRYGDLILDSISLALGVYFREPPGKSFGDRRGLELSLGVGFPLAARADGPWLEGRGLVRFDDPERSRIDNASGAALLTFGWHAFLGK